MQFDFKHCITVSSDCVFISDDGGMSWYVKAAEQPRSPYFAEAVKDEAEFPHIVRPFGQRDIEMIARDGPARPAAPVVIQEPAKTSHGPIAGLTVLENRDHRFGLVRF